MRAPSPPTRHPLGHAPAIARAPLATLERWMQTHGDVVRLRIGTTPMHVVFGPDQVRHILQTNAGRYTKATRGYRTLALFMGDGLLTSDGEHWRSQSKMIRPAFARGAIDGFAGVMRRVAEDTADRWAGLAGTTVDVSAEMMRLTLRVIGHVLFSRELDARSRATAAAILDLQEEANRRIVSAFDWPAHWPTPANRRLAHARRAIVRAIESEIAERRGTPTGEDVLGALLAARDERGEGMTKTALVDELVTLFLAGHESTSHALTWSWYLLARHPEIAAKLRESLRGRDLTALPELTYLDAVVKESLRLYPPAWSIGRAPAEDDVVGGFTLPAGRLVMLSAWATHRHPDHWADPNEFRPERWLDGTAARGAYFPFGLGPRTCIGARFATMEAAIVLGTLAARFAPALPPGHEVVPEPLVTLRPQGGLPMELKVVERGPSG